MNDIKQTYGLQDGKTVSINEVESGLACNCICPACKQILIAKKRAEKQHHFAHYNAEDCGKGTETVIHKLAKDIISKSTVFRTPALTLGSSDTIIYEETDIPVDHVKLEHRIDTIIPDIVIESKGKELLVEITVTHDLVFPKTRTISKKGFPTIEVYAKELIRQNYLNGDFFLQDNAFQFELIYGTRFKQWIYNEKVNKIKTVIKDNYAARFTRKTIKFDDYDYLNYIDNCPVGARIWKSGFKKGKPYANIDDDCPSCSFCVGMDFKDWIDPRYEFHQHSFPIAVYCCGNYQMDFQKLIKSLRYSGYL